MRYVIAVCLVIYAACLYAEEPSPSVCISGCPNVRRVVVHQNVVSAQEHAEHLAATGTFAHCSRRGGGYEGIGMSSAGPDDACRRCCYWGQRRVREIGTAWCQVRRAWVAVVRYF